MPRKVSVQLDLDAAAYLAEAKAVQKETKSAGQDLKELGRAVDLAGIDLDETAASAAIAKRQINDLGDAADSTADDLKKLDKATVEAKADVKGMGKATDEASDSLDGLTKSSKASQDAIDTHNRKVAQAVDALKALDARIATVKTSVHELGVEFGKTGDAAAGKSLSSERTMLNRLLKLKTELEDSVKSPVELPGLKLDLSALSSKLMPALIGLGVLASPAIGAIVSGAVVGGVGLGGIVGGVAAAAHDDRVKEAWAGFTKSLTADSFGAKAFVDPVIKGIHILDEGLQGLHIGDVLGKAADAVPKLAQGFVAFANGVMPGVSAALDHADEIADILGQGLGDLGYDIGKLIKDFAESKGAMEGLRLTFQLVGTTIEVVDEAVTGLGDVFHWMLSWLPNVGDAFADILVWLPPLQEYLHKSADEARGLGGGSDTANAAIRSLKAGVYETAKTTQEYTDAMAAATRMTNSMSEAWDVLHGKTLSADEALLAAKQAVKDISDTFQDGTKSVQGNSQAAVENRLALEHAAEKAAAAATAYQNLTGDVVGANKIMSDAKKAAEDATGATGKQRTEVDKLANSLFTIPPYVPVNISVVTTYTSRGVPSQATKTALLDREESMRIGARASGGPVGPGAYWVGERGPELLTLGQGSTGHVYPTASAGTAAINQSSWRPMPAAASSGGGTTVNNYVTVNAPPLSSPVEVGGAVVQALKQYEMANGNGWRS